MVEIPFKTEEKKMIKWREEGLEVVEYFSMY